MIRSDLMDGDNKELHQMEPTCSFIRIHTPSARTRPSREGGGLGENTVSLLPSRQRDPQSRSEALILLANEAMRDISFLLRREHNESVENPARPRGIAERQGRGSGVPRNAEISTQFESRYARTRRAPRPSSRKKVSELDRWKDEEALSRGVYKTYTEENLRDPQTVALDMYREVNSGTNLRLISTPRRWTVSPTSSSSWRKEAARPTVSLPFETLLAPENLLQFLVDKMKHLGTAACPPYHIAVELTPA